MMRSHTGSVDPDKLGYGALSVAVHHRMYLVYTLCYFTLPPSFPTTEAVIQFHTKFPGLICWFAWYLHAFPIQVRLPWPSWAPGHTGGSCSTGYCPANLGLFLFNLLATSPNLYCCIWILVTQVHHWASLNVIWRNSAQQSSLSKSLQSLPIPRQIDGPT